MIRILIRIFALAVGGLLGASLLAHWPLNFMGACGLVVLGYCCGRVHEAEISVRPVVTIAPLPRAHLLDTPTVTRRQAASRAAAFGKRGRLPVIDIQ